MRFDRLFPPRIARLGKAADLEGLTNALRHRNPDIRLDAALTIRGLKVPLTRNSGDALFAVSSDRREPRAIRLAAASALAYLPHGERLEPLVSALENTQTDGVLGAAEIAGAARLKHAVEPLLSRLHSTAADPRAYAMVAWALGRIGDTRAVEGLADVARSGNTSVRHEASLALVRLGDARGVSSLLALIHDWKDPATRRQVENRPIPLGDSAPVLEAVAALAQLRKWNAVQLLIGILRKQNESVVHYLHTRLMSSKSVSEISDNFADDLRSADEITAIAATIGTGIVGSGDLYGNEDTMEKLQAAQLGSKHKSAINLVAPLTMYALFEGNARPLLDYGEEDFDQARIRSGSPFVEDVPIENRDGKSWRDMPYLRKEPIWGGFRTRVSQEFIDRYMKSLNNNTRTPGDRDVAPFVIGYLGHDESADRLVEDLEKTEGLVEDEAEHISKFKGKARRYVQTTVVELYLARHIAAGILLGRLRDKRSVRALLRVFVAAESLGIREEAGGLIMALAPGAADVTLNALRENAALLDQVSKALVAIGVDS